MREAARKPTFTSRSNRHRASSGRSAVFAILSSFLTVASGTHALADGPHDIVRSSLVYIVTSAETRTGVPLGTTGTGVVVSADGYILTSYHLLSKLQKSVPAGTSINPESVGVRVSIGRKVSDPTDAAAVIFGIPETDLLLIKVAETATPLPFAQLALAPDLVGLGVGSTVYTSGFPASLNDIAYSDEVSSKNGPGGFTWVLKKPPIDGQSGSPVYNDKGKLVGVMKGDVSGGAGAMVPIHLASNLLDPIKFRLLEARMADLYEAERVSQCFLIRSTLVNRVLLQMTVSQHTIEQSTATLDRFKTRDHNGLSLLEKQLIDEATNSLSVAQDQYSKARAKASELSTAPTDTCSPPG
jgi:S1-C subfamily serine protease